MRNELFEFLINDYWKTIQVRSNLKGLSKEGDWLQAAKHFVYYAYERNVGGAARRYREIACDVLDRHLAGRSNWNSNLDRDIWEDFQKCCKEPVTKNGETALPPIKPNKKVDPLRPSSDERMSLPKFVMGLRNDNTVATWALRHIKEGKTKDAYKQLQSIWGIKQKIAAFYLRDIFWLGYSLNPPLTLRNPGDVDFLQPIDVWILRAIASVHEGAVNRRTCIKIMGEVEKVHKIPAGGANIAFWQLGSQFVSEEYYTALIPIFDSRRKIVSNENTNDALEYLERFSKLGTLLKSLLDGH